MGGAAAIAFAREGADVAIDYLPDEEADAGEVVDLIRAAGRKAVTLPSDLRDAAFCRRLVDDPVRQLGSLDTVVSNARRQQSRASILDLSDEDFDATGRPTSTRPPTSRRRCRTSSPAPPSSRRRRNRPTTPRRTSTTMPRPRRPR